MNFFELKKRLGLLSEEEKEYIYKLPLIEAVNYLKTV